jgi:integrase
MSWRVWSRSAPRAPGRGNGLVFAPPKGGRERDVLLPSSVALRLSAHIGEFSPSPVALLWRTLDGEPVAARLLFANAHGNAIKSNVFDSGHWQPGPECGRDCQVARERFSRAASPLRLSAAARRRGIKALSECLGHHDPGFTLRIYVHLMPDAAERMRSVIDQALSADADGPSTAPAVTE